MILMHMLVSDDIKNVDLTKIHNLSGPIGVEGAEPGDCLVVDILDGKIRFLRHFLTILLSDPDYLSLSYAVRENALGLHGARTASSTLSCRLIQGRASSS